MGGLNGFCGWCHCKRAAPSLYNAALILTCLDDLRSEPAADLDQLCTAKPVPRRAGSGDGAVGRADRAGQQIASDQMGVDPGCGGAALSDRPHDKRLSAAHVAGDEDPLFASHEVLVACDIAPLVAL